MTRLALIFVLSICWMLVEPPATGRAEATGDWVLKDRLVAVVDDDPIFLSDLRRTRAWTGIENSTPTPLAGALPLTDRTILDRLIERRLRLHEVERYSDQPISRDRLDSALADMESRVGGPESLDRRLAASELDREGLRELLRRQLRVLSYIDERIGARIFVDEDEVRRYYQNELRVEMAKRNRPLPAFEQVADGIRLLLREQALNREIQAWTDELRQEAKIIDLLDRAPSPDSLPPVRIEIPK